MAGKPRKSNDNPNSSDSSGEPPKIDLRQAQKRLLELLAIPGRSGEEMAVAEYIRSQLVAAGASDTQIRSDQANRKTLLRGDTGNLIFKLPGTMRAPRRLLMAHMDTVPICVGSRPQRQGESIHSADPETGLGGDDRAGVAVVLQSALEVLRCDRPHPPLTFLWTVQEEVGLHGARHVNLRALGSPKLAFNFDGGAPEKLTIGATGGYRMSIKIHGRASHAGVAPEEGVSAIVIAAVAIADLQKEGWLGLVEKPEGTGTSNVGVIRGGEATNVVTDLVHVRAEARSHDARFRRRIVREIEHAFQNAARRVRSVSGRKGTVEVEGQLDYESYLLPRDTPCLDVAQRAAEAEGLQPSLAVADGGLDANWMNAHGIPTVSLGCGQKNIHTVDETLNLVQFEQACRIAVRVAFGTA
ncbi:MAG: M20/M25/M40 family metallo-hydrolase [Planctomycetales bacterium]|nr:M20/M25/M40 family metallo-hydrolase [Planctomycetales bacterium]